MTVLVGTLYPLVAEAIRGVKVSVGEPFFNRMTLPMCVALLFLMGVGPALPWRRASADVVRRQLLPPTIGALIGGVAAWLAGAHGVYAVLFNFLNALLNSGVGLCGRSVIQPLAGRSEPT